MASLSITRYAGGFRFHFSSLGSGTKTIFLTIDDDEKLNDGEGVSTSKTTYSIYVGYDDDINLSCSPNTSYSYKWYIDYGTSNESGSGTARTDSLISSTCTASDITQNSATFTVSNDTDTSYFRYRLTIDGEDYFYPSKTTTDLTSDWDDITFNVTGLSAGTSYSYSLNTAFYHTDDVGSYLGYETTTGTITTEEQTGDPSWLTINCVGFTVDTDDFESIDGETEFVDSSASSSYAVTVEELSTSTDSTIRYKITPTNTNNRARVYINIPNNLLGYEFTYALTQGSEVSTSNPTTANTISFRKHPTSGMLINGNITKDNDGSDYFYIAIAPSSQIVLTLTATRLAEKTITVFNEWAGEGSSFSLQGDLHADPVNKSIPQSSSAWFVGETVTLSSTSIPTTEDNDEYEWDGIYSANASGSLNSRLTTDTEWDITLYSDTNETTYYSLIIDHYNRYYLNSIAGDSYVQSTTIVDSNGDDVKGTYIREGASVTFGATFSEWYEFDYWKNLGSDTQFSTLEKTITVSEDLTLYCYSKEIVHYTATAIVGTSGMTVTVSSGGRENSASYGSNAEIEVASGDPVTWTITNAGGNSLFSYVLSNGWVKNNTTDVSYIWSSLTDDLSITITGTNEIHFEWSYHSCSIEDGTPLARISGLPAYKWNKATAETTTDYKKYYGFYVNHEEWTKLQSMVNLQRSLYGLSEYDFSSYASGDNFTAAAFNEVVNAMNSFLNSSNQLPTVSAGDACTATLFNNLMIYLNDTTKHKY